MKWQDMSLTIALCAAVGATSILARLAADEYTLQLSDQLSGEPARQLARTGARAINQDRDRIGSATGTGDAIMASVGPLAQLAAQAGQAQPFLSRDPAGFGKVGSDPSESVLPEGLAYPAAGPPPGAPSDSVTDDSSPTPFGLPPDTASGPAVPALPMISRVVAKPPKSQSPAAASPAKPSPEQSAQATPAAPAPALAPASPPASQAPSADPAPMADSETDPFSKVASASFRPGKTDVQFGRQVKLTRPHVTISGMFDVMSLRHARVVLGIRTDPTGKVADVEILHSSGSNDLDLPCQRAAYDWWFEPPKDARGKALSDAFPFTVAFN